MQRKTIIKLVMQMTNALKSVKTWFEMAVANELGSKWSYSGFYSFSYCR